MKDSAWQKANEETRRKAREAYYLRTERYKWREVGGFLEITEARARQLYKIFKDEFDKKRRNKKKK